jgi:molybdopterin biosynthesis enzyme
MLTVDDALTVALSAVRRVSGTETLPLRRCVGRVAAWMPLPPSTRARSTDTASAHGDLGSAASGSFHLTGTTLAGDSLAIRSKAGELCAC